MYFITCFQKVEEEGPGWPHIGASRIFGYFPTYKEAAEALNQNSCDMYERLYNYAVVEEIPCGIHPYVGFRQFFKYNDEKDGYFPIQEPKALKNFCNFALG